MYALKKKADDQQLPQDSAYARLLHKIGAYEFNIDNKYNVALLFTLKALRINTAKQSWSSPTLAVTDLYNIAFFYDNLSLLKKALVYYDSAILFAIRGPDIDNVAAASWLSKAYIYFRMGDFEKATEESDRAKLYALRRGDSLDYLISLNQRAQALYCQGKPTAALQDTRVAISLARSLHEDFQLASALKTQGITLGILRDFQGAETSMKQCINVRVRSKDFHQVCFDYNDLGVFYNDSLRAFEKAGAAYSLAMQYAKKGNDSVNLAVASLNLGKNYFSQHNVEKAGACYAQAMDYLKIGRDGGLTRNPTARELDAIGNKQIIQTLFNAKTELLLAMYQRTHQAKWLTACLQTSLLNDTLIRYIRHEQMGEQSKLYWRNQTRTFFVHALYACYLAHDDRLAFYFMEESRSVLLQDKLNELGAHALLPPAEAAKEERIRIEIVELEQKRNALPDTSIESRAVLQKLLTAKESLEQFIHSLETTYPAYYQYKYADDAKSLSALQDLLSKNRQTFIDYFIEDTLCFALCIQPAATHFLKIDCQKIPISDQLIRMATGCSDENALNSNYSQFLARSNDLYRLLFEPFHLAPGRIIICQDNYLIPFEALTANPAKPDFLLNNYAFSYVYSARYLLNQHQQPSGRGDFLGIAPVSFPADDGLPDLVLSEEALRNCSAPYGRRKLLLHGDASRKNFLRQVCDYNTTTILTHARADIADDEPVLFMNDSAIHLSELQLLKNPAAKLVVLSACQTNIGKNRNGEGIFSLARGLSAAGIPAVAATQWMADESAIYSISQKFNEYIFRGMHKDEALQQAKLYYIGHYKRGSILPCYWAAMILIGNTDPVQFAPTQKARWLIEVGILLALLIAFAFFRKFLYI